MSYCSRSRRRRFTVLGFKSWAYSRIYGHFQQHLYCACAETVIYELPQPRFPITVQNFGDLATFSVDYCILYSECPPYFYFQFVWPTDLESIPLASIPTLIISTKFEDPTTIRSWVTSYNCSHWLPLKMRTRPLRMRRITWPVSRGSKTITFLESPTLICLFAIQFRWLYDEYY